MKHYYEHSCKSSYGHAFIYLEWILRRIAELYGKFSLAFLQSQLCILKNAYYISSSISSYFVIKRFFGISGAQQCLKREVFLFGFFIYNLIKEIGDLKFLSFENIHLQDSDHIHVYTFPPLSPLVCVCACVRVDVCVCLSLFVVIIVIKGP